MASLSKDELQQVLAIMHASKQGTKEVLIKRIKEIVCEGKLPAAKKPAAATGKSGKKLKPCAEGQVRNPDTNRCKSVGKTKSKAKKPSAAKSSSSTAGPVVYLFQAPLKFYDTDTGKTYKGAPELNAAAYEDLDDALQKAYGDIIEYLPLYLRINKFDVGLFTNKKNEYFVGFSLRADAKLKTADVKVTSDTLSNFVKDENFTYTLEDVEAEVRVGSGKFKLVAAKPVTA